MPTLNGFLGQPLGDPPRITKGQKGIVLRAARVALEAAYPPAAASGLLVALQVALDGLPDFRGCTACDFFHSAGLCTLPKHGTGPDKKQPPEIPADFIPKGCDEFQDDGVPF